MGSRSQPACQATCLPAVSQPASRPARLRCQPRPAKGWLAGWLAGGMVVKAKATKYSAKLMIQSCRSSGGGDKISDKILGDKK